MRTHARYPVCLAVCFTLVLGAVTEVASADGALGFRKLLDAHSPELVTVKYVLKMKMGSMGDQESETEITGVMISADGLVLCSNTRFGGFMALISRFSGREFTANPTDLKVLVGDDNQGVEAQFVARDTELDLAWVRIKKPGDKKYAFLDLSKSAKPAIGDPIVCVYRMDKYFDRLAVVGESRIGGITKKPRELYVPSGGSIEAMGTPVFTPEGGVLGLTVMQMPEAEEAGGNPMSVISRMSGLQSMSNLILPAGEIVKATKRALETAATKSADDEPTTKPAAKAAKKAAPKPADRDEEK